MGSAGSEQVGLAEGLLSDSETLVIYAQPPGEVARATELLSLSSTEAELVPQLRGASRCGRWAGARSSSATWSGPTERALVDTDAAMAAPVSAASSAGRPVALAAWPRLVLADGRADRGAAAVRAGARWATPSATSRHSGAAGRGASGSAPSPDGVSPIRCGPSPPHSVVVVGPTQSGKTSGIAIPAILGVGRPGRGGRA